MRYQVFLWAAAVLLFSGCSALNPWDSSYACKGYPAGVNCKSAREVYELTNYRDSLEKRKDGKSKNCTTCSEAGKGGQKR